ncbi:hypothetical protein [Chryseobacterium sp. ERMR1:04]|uniref:bacteriocin-like protein n=1 Tax=Chryseobacterium sp. ERMR1:04 TaxID=1705393 RepID=UPI0006C8CC1C|nr:hypothetical protein [Chryseobacterium sp. ERMR1:04]KPH12566.1 hypothetical protein AMQ68_16910 [Chryseobacterium sp. ERMR1:04]
MKNLKKLNRRDLEQIAGAGISPNSYCNGCPTGAFGPNDTHSCEAYWGLPDSCRKCVLVNMECFVPIQF